MKKKTIIPALLFSVAFHALLAAALALCLEHAPAPDGLAQLDLASVDLSFAETVEETAAAAASAPPASVETTTPPPPADEESPPPPADAAFSPRPAEIKLPSPMEIPEPLPPIVAAAPRQARVDAPAKPCRAIRPDYPRVSRLRGEHGDVDLELDIAADGTVASVRILASPGYPLLDEAAVRAVRAARFTPARSGGRAVASTVRLTLNFRFR